VAEVLDSGFHLIVSEEVDGESGEVLLLLIEVGLEGLDDESDL